MVLPARLRALLRSGFLRLADLLAAAAPSGMRPPLNLYAFLLRMGELPQVLDAPPTARQVVVLAPHPDDETIGCGGVIKHYTSAGTPVSVIVISDGSRGGVGGAELASRRREEAKKATAALGVASLSFLDLPDGDVRPIAEATATLRQELDHLRPDIVFLPFVLDKHRDHLQTSALFLAAIGPLTATWDGPACWGYETRTPLYANRVVDISAVAETKWQAIEAYESQTGLDYLATTRGLNAFRWLHTFRGRGYAEAFYACSLAEYRRLYEMITR